MFIVVTTEVVTLKKEEFSAIGCRAVSNFKLPFYRVVKMSYEQRRGTKMLQCL
jgi:hypothetical protein